MKNYQLYRTNVLLGGQMQLDLVTSSKNGASLKVDNAHLSPISPTVPFTYSPQENILLYEHKDNIREFYKKIEGSFYQSFVNPELSHDWPIIYKDGDDTPKRYNDTYIYGCRRMNYDRYQEQFQILVPVWLESVQESLRFVVNLWPLVENDEGKLVSASKPLNYKSIEFHPDVEGEDFDSKFSKYLFQYFKYVKIYQDEEQSGNQVININFNGTSSVHGLEVTSGNLTTKELPSIVDNILYRERPLMEVDNMIIENFKNNHMICKQLMNFSICFSMQDIISPSITKELLGSPFRVSVDVYVDDVLLEKKDFFNNYETINVMDITEDTIGPESEEDRGSTSIITVSETNKNVVSYLKDNNCLDLIDKNKLSQNIIHWSITGQNDYIFNVYDGFGGSINGDKVMHNYNAYPSTLEYGETPAYNITGLNWIKYLSPLEVSTALGIGNNEDLTQSSDPYHIQGFQNLVKLLDHYSPNSDSMIHGIKYAEKWTPVTIGTGVDERTITDFYVAMVASPKVELFDYWTIGNVVETFPGGVQVWDVMSGGQIPDALKTSIMYLIFIPSSSWTSVTVNPSLTLKGVLSMLSSANDPVLKQWAEVISSAEWPKTVKFNRGLSYKHPDGPSKSLTEFQYVKKDINVNNYVIRYDGLISPTFIDISGDNLWKNNVYYKDMLTIPEFTNSVFSVYGGTGYEPLYPSINYFAIKHKTLDEDHYKNLDADGENEGGLYISDERPWFDNSQVLYVKKELTMNIILNTRGVEDVDALIEQGIIEELERIYGVHGNYVQSIYKLYEMKMDWEYVSPTDIYTYNYYITLKLK